MRSTYPITFLLVTAPILGGAFSTHHLWLGETETQQPLAEQTIVQAPVKKTDAYVRARERTAHLKREVENLQDQIDQLDHAMRNMRTQILEYKANRDRPKTVYANHVQLIDESSRFEQGESLPERSFTPLKMDIESDADMQHEFHETIQDSGHHCLL